MRFFALHLASFYSARSRASPYGIWQKEFFLCAGTTKITFCQIPQCSLPTCTISHIYFLHKLSFYELIIRCCTSSIRDGSGISASVSLSFLFLILFFSAVCQFGLTFSNFFFLYIRGRLFVTDKFVFIFSPSARHGT